MILSNDIYYFKTVMIIGGQINCTSQKKNSNNNSNNSNKDLQEKEIHKSVVKQMLLFWLLIPHKNVQTMLVEMEK